MDECRKKDPTFGERGKKYPISQSFSIMKISGDRDNRPLLVSQQLALLVLNGTNAVNGNLKSLIIPRTPSLFLDPPQDPQPWPHIRTETHSPTQSHPVIPPPSSSSLGIHCLSFREPDPLSTGPPYRRGRCLLFKGPLFNCLPRLTLGLSA